LPKRRVHCWLLGRRRPTLPDCCRTDSTKDKQDACVQKLLRLLLPERAVHTLHMKQFGDPSSWRRHNGLSWMHFLRSRSSGKVSRRADRNDGMVGWNCSLAFRNFRDNGLIHRLQGSGCGPMVPGQILTRATQPTHEVRQLSNSFCAFWFRLRVPTMEFSETRTLDVHMVSRPWQAGASLPQCVGQLAARPAIG
jgi:hypothetical protein